MTDLSTDPYTGVPNRFKRKIVVECVIDGQTYRFLDVKTDPMAPGHPWWGSAFLKKNQPDSEIAKRDRRIASMQVLLDIRNKRISALQDEKLELVRKMTSARAHLNKIIGYLSP